MRFWKALTVVVITGCFGTAQAAPQKYTLQADQSQVDFGWYLGPDEIKGTMPVASADIILDIENLQNSDVTVAVDVKGAKAGFAFATQGMKSKQILWAKKHPEILFESTRFVREGAKARVEGNLTVRGVTKPTVFIAELYRQRGTESGDHSKLAVHLTGSLSRSAFGADGWSDLAGDQINLSIIARMQIEQPS